MSQQPSKSSKNASKPEVQADPALLDGDYEMITLADGQNANPFAGAGEEEFEECDDFVMIDSPNTQNTPTSPTEQDFSANTQLDAFDDPDSSDESLHEDSESDEEVMVVMFQRRRGVSEGPPGSQGSDIDREPDGEETRSEDGSASGGGEGGDGGDEATRERENRGSRENNTDITRTFWEFVGRCAS